ncbi:MAG TPA: hypothetical protein VJG90_02480 [Candidatus Nanoarchaeia archaeon]|nr:hypothetical protein [Candidatus Nanoarchaeia archaeon]
MIDMQLFGLEKHCGLCGYVCESSDAYCSACGENLKQRAANYR